MKIRFTLFAFLILTLNLPAQSLCDGQRFRDTVFAGEVQETINIKFGENAQPTLSNPAARQELFLNFYDAPSDTAQKRPLVILAFGGAFIAGVRQSPDIVYLCTWLAEHGYATAAIDYRLSRELLLGGNPRTGTLAVIKGMHDMKAAVRFFRADAAGDNRFRIDPDHIIIGGVSAGALAANHAAYLDSFAELPPYLQESDTVGLGGVEGLSGNPGFSSEVFAVVNLAGAIGDTAWMEADEASLISMHGNQDEVVPYAVDTVTLFGLNLPIMGSATMHEAAGRLGLYERFFTFNGANHVPFVNQFNGQPIFPYMDTTTMFIRDNLAELLCGPVSSRDDAIVSTDFRVWPQPASGRFYVSAEADTQLELFDMQGKKASILVSDEAGRKLVRFEGLNPGIYVLRAKDRNGMPVGWRKIQLTGN
ncbi:MAG: T9SS type A sorting domain-containing protein [Bacteroidia bacterium]